MGPGGYGGYGFFGMFFGIFVFLIVLVISALIMRWVFRINDIIAKLDRIIELIEKRNVSGS
jgi:sensor histidine kinase YesM